MNISEGHQDMLDYRDYMMIRQKALERISKKYVHKQFYVTLFYKCYCQIIWILIYMPNLSVLQGYC